MAAWPRTAQPWSLSSCLPPNQPTSHFRERHCCHGNARPMIPLAENHLSANLAGTSLPRSNNGLLVFCFPHAQIPEGRAAGPGTQASSPGHRAL